MNAYWEIPKAAREKNKVAFFKNSSLIRRELVKPHWHDGYEILYIRRGKGEQMINGTVLEFYQGDIVIIKPGESHATVATAPNGCDVDVVQFFDSFLQDDSISLHALRSGVVRPKDGNMAFAFDRLSDLDRFDPHSRGLIREGMIRFVCGLCIQLCVPGAPSRLSAPISRICDFLESSQDISLKFVARHFNYSPEHLSRKFKKETGVSFRVWCDRIRMRKAAEMLNAEGLALPEIAMALGYAEESSFVRAFKRAYGMTPGAYKRHLVRLGD